MDIRKGFTLIELVIVIVILGILAAFIVPRFSSLSSEARASTVKALEGSLHSASALAHSVAVTQAAITSVDCTTITSVGVEGASVAMSNCYPTAAAGGIVNALGDIGGFSTSGAIIFRRQGANTPANCQVTYTAATSKTTPPVIASDVTKC